MVPGAGAVAATDAHAAGAVRNDDFVLKTMNFVLQMMVFVLKMMNQAATPRVPPVGHGTQRAGG